MSPLFLGEAGKPRERAQPGESAALPRPPTYQTFGESGLIRMDVYLALANVSVPWPALVAIGLLVGTLQGFFGVGGGWLTTPSLNILGFPIIYAIGTDLAYTSVTGIVGSWRHHRLGNLAVRFAGVLGASGILGIEASRRLVFFLEAQGLAEGSVRAAYILLLLGVGGGIVAGYVWSLRKGATDPGSGGQRVSSAGFRVQALAIPPLVGLPGAATAVSLWLLAGIGLGVGALAGFLGTGGGFILVPVLIYLVGVPARFAVASSLLSIAIANGYGGLVYGINGKVELLAVVLMLTGSVVGAQLGATATVYVRGRYLQLLLGLMLVAAGAAVALRQANLSAASAVVMFTTAAAMSAVILGLLIRARRRAPRVGARS